MPKSSSSTTATRSSWQAVLNTAPTASKSAPAIPETTTETATSTAITSEIRANRPPFSFPHLPIVSLALYRRGCIFSFRKHAMLLFGRIGFVTDQKPFPVPSKITFCASSIETGKDQLSCLFSFNC